LWAITWLNSGFDYCAGGRAEVVYVINKEKEKETDRQTEKRGD
jgi:hypothetical protein